MDHTTLPLFSLQEETKEIPLTGGKVAIVDAADYDFLMRWTWYARKNRNGWYACRRTRIKGKKINLWMHRVLLKASKGIMVDHKNGNGLDNRRRNIRLCTNQQNQYNRTLSANNTSGYKGVVWHKKTKKWQARIKVDGKRKYLGYYATREDAARAYDSAALLYHGEFANLNFS